jgi:Na+/H+-dicarboxylate symporter
MLSTLRAYFFQIILLLSICFGGLYGYLFSEYSQLLKPLGDIFINLIFTAIVPLIFFAISSAIARAGSIGRLGKIISSMSFIFLLTGLIAALYSLLVVMLFPPAQGVSIPLGVNNKSAPINLSEQLVSIFTVSNFSQLLSHEHILALIIFSILVGLAVTQSKDKGLPFQAFLAAGEAVFMRFFDLIMYYAPIGFFAYFAVLVSELGPKLMEHYLRVSVLYYSSALLYFVLAYTTYAFFAARSKGVQVFWSQMLLPATTALATCSSAASIPANLTASKRMLVPAEIVDTVIPLGSLIHKDGSVIGGMFKIAFLFGLFGLPFTDTSTLLTAIGIAFLVGTVMGAIPSGGMLGELLIIAVYGFPPNVLIVIAAISIIIDPIATLLNVIGNSVSSMMIARLVEGNLWWTKNECNSPETENAGNTSIP